MTWRVQWALTRVLPRRWWPLWLHLREFGPSGYVSYRNAHPEDTSDES